MKICKLQKFLIMVTLVVAVMLFTGCAGGKLTEKVFGPGGGLSLKVGPKWDDRTLAQRRELVETARQNGGFVLNGWSHGFAVPQSSLPANPTPRYRETYLSNGRTFHHTVEGSQVWANVWQDWRAPGVMYVQPQVFEWKFEAEGSVAPFVPFVGTQVAPGQGRILGNTGTRTWSVVPAPREAKPPRVIRLNK